MGCGLFRCWEPAAGSVRARSSASPSMGSTSFVGWSASTTSCVSSTIGWCFRRRREGESGRCRYPPSCRRALAEHLERFGTSTVVLPRWEPRARSGGPSCCSQTERGTLTRAYYTHNAWKPALLSAGVERSRENGMHALIHHYASVLLETGVSIRAVSEYLGHNDPGFTLRTYAHLMPESEDRARAVIDAALGNPAESSRNAKQA